MRRVTLYLFLVLLLTVQFGAYALTQQYDSTGIETVNGKTYIIHKVAPKETLFSLSQRYRTNVNDIRSANDGLSEGLKIGQTVRVPYIKPQSIPSGAIRHTVAPKETLYGISRKYGVSVQDIKKWNNLTVNSLDLGQELVLYKEKSTNNASSGADLKKVSTRPGDLTHKVQPSETLYSISRKYGISINDLKKINQLTGNDLDLGQILIIRNKRSEKNTTKNTEKASDKKSTSSAQTNSSPPEKKSEYQPYEKSMNEIKRVNNSSNQSNSTESSFNKKVEMGFAEVIKANTTSKKWLALHRSAPIGTIIRVQNQMNNSWVFVRVVGVLPNTGVNDKVLIKISETAYEKLGAINDRFPVEISYVP